jgi:predicted ATP-dependent endonuclease of OLD family
MVRIFAEFFYHSHVLLKKLHDQSLIDLQQQVMTVADKWRQVILSMPIEALHQAVFLERVKRSADYFGIQLRDILTKPIELSGKVETKNKQAIRRMSNTLPDLRQTWLAKRYLLAKMAERGFTVDRYLYEKQMSMLDALDEGMIKKGSKSKSKKVKK